MGKLRGSGRYYPEDAVCVVAGCDSRPKRRWMCQKHWNRWNRHGDPNVAYKSWGLTEKNPFCVWGHDKREVGVTQRGQCKACITRHARRQHQNRERRERPIPNLRAIREEFGLSQQRFADLADIHVNTVFAIEQGRNCRPAIQEKVIAAVASLMAKKRRSRKVLRVAKGLTHA